MHEIKTKRGVGTVVIITSIAGLIVLGSVLFFNMKPEEEIMMEEAEVIMHNAEEMMEEGEEMMEEGEEMMREAGGSHEEGANPDLSQ